MGILGKLFGSSDGSSSEDKVLTILAPISGKVVSITEVPDPTFAEKLLGDGVAIEPAEGSVVTPIAGTITALPDSLHAFTTKNAQGIEVLVHVGLETVSMGGEGFDAKLSAGADVQAGDPIITVNLKAIEEAENLKITPVVITSMHKVESVEFLVKDQVVKAGDPILKVTLI